MSELKMQEILKLMPHRYPFLLIDRVLETTDESIVAIKNISVNEPQFTGHFPEMPVMPGVLMIEAMAQAAGILCYTRLLKDDPNEKFMLFATINDTKFKVPVVPGDVLKMTITVDRFNGKLLRANGKAEVDGNIACETKLGLWLLNKDEVKLP